jgi:hypothetical protein
VDVLRGEALRPGRDDEAPDAVIGRGWVEALDFVPN